MNDAFAVINEKELESFVQPIHSDVFVPLSCMDISKKCIDNATTEDVWACFGCSNDNCSCNRRILGSCF
ncbi:MAG: hypothetical protein ACKUBY_00225 [Candidatus Moraniibacteriota bacterium]|jgi:hypothetical protein